MFLTDPQPLEKRIVVKKIDVRPHSVIPTAAEAFEKFRAKVGEVELVGPDVTKVAVGDLVIYGEGAGLEISHLNDISAHAPRIFVMNEGDVLVKFKRSVVAVASALPPTT